MYINYLFFRKSFVCKSVFHVQMFRLCILSDACNSVYQHILLLLLSYVILHATTLYNTICHKPIVGLINDILFLIFTHTVNIQHYEQTK